MKLNRIMVVLPLLVAGCALRLPSLLDPAIAKNAERVAQLRAAAAKDHGDNVATATVNRPFIGARSIPFKADRVLPPRFREIFEFRYPGRQFTLADAITQIAYITAIPMRIEPDAVSKEDQNKLITMNAAAAPEDMLNQVCRNFGLSWDLKDGTVVVQRYISRTFTLKVQPGIAVFDFALGKQGQSTAQGGNAGAISTGFTSQSNSRKNGSSTPMASTLQAIEKVLSKEGKATGSEATGSITVFDTAEGVERAAKVIERENEVLTRNATFHVEVVSFRSSDGDEAGIDWQVAFNNLNKFGLTMTSPATLTSASGNTVNLRVLSTPKNPGRFDGTQAFIRMLNEHGTTHTVYSNDIRTRNRALTVASSLAQTVYLARTTPAPATTTSLTGAVAGVPGLEPGTVTAGIDLKLQPNILDSNQISLMFSLGIVDLIDIAKLSSGVGNNETSIEGPETKGFEFLEEMWLTPGATTMITGYERTLAAYTQRRLGHGLPLALGGSSVSDLQREKLFIFITPTVVGSAF